MSTRYGLAVLLIGIATPAVAESSANELLRSFDTGTPAMRAEIGIRMSEVYNGLSWSNERLSSMKRQRLFCAPSVPFSGAQMLEIMRDAVRILPPIGEAPYGLALFEAVARSFPCK